MLEQLEYLPLQLHLVPSLRHQQQSIVILHYRFSHNVSIFIAFLQVKALLLLLVLRSDRRTKGLAFGWTLLLILSCTLILFKSDFIVGVFFGFVFEGEVLRILILFLPLHCEGGCGLR